MRFGKRKGLLLLGVAGILNYLTFSSRARHAMRACLSHLDPYAYTSSAQIGSPRLGQGRPRRCLLVAWQMSCQWFEPSHWSETSFAVGATLPAVKEWGAGFPAYVQYGVCAEVHHTPRGHLPKAQSVIGQPAGGWAHLLLDCLRQSRRPGTPSSYAGLVASVGSLSMRTCAKIHQHQYAASNSMIQAGRCGCGRAYRILSPHPADIRMHTACGQPVSLVPLRSILCPSLLTHA